ncbi:MAG: DNA cytosine methyltransferase [Planctomycetaceae bacterium]|jgi:DNA (cytosine-5)-methyltransferase 1|nr:DNA cytosine methyltransferase [Planctomycetaceae bacterium]
MSYPKIYTYIDIFAGCGGLSLGLHNAGWKGIFAIEKNIYAFQTLEHNLIKKIKHFNWPKWLPQQEHDINTIIKQYADRLKNLRGKITLVAGGPPCQGFSIAGQRNEKDERNKLINSYIKFVSLLYPQLVFFENVKGFTMEFRHNTRQRIKYSEMVCNELDKIGYHVFGDLINFGEYGIPQKRTRFILVGIRKDIKNSNIENVKLFFKKLATDKYKFLREKNLGISPTVADALSDLVCGNSIVDTPDRNGFKSGLYRDYDSCYQYFLRQRVERNAIPDSHSFAKHTEKVTKRLKYVQSVSVKCKNIDNSLKNKIGIKTQVLIPLQSKEQSPTVTSHPDDMIHYCEPRILTVREYARLQSFPDDFEFKGKYTTGGKLRKFEVPRYTQVGNAIPPLFGEQVGIILKGILNGK